MRPRTMRAARTAAINPNTGGWPGDEGLSSRAWTLLENPAGYSSSPIAARTRLRISFSVTSENLGAEAQPFQRSIGARLCGFGRGFHHRGGLVEAEIEVIAESDRQALVVRKSIDRSPEFRVIR